MSNARIAILSLVAERPMHGYEIEHVIEERGMRDWTDIGFSSIYYHLKKLEGNEWVKAHVAQPGGRGPARRVYQITGSGLEALREATLSALANPHHDRRSILLGLANLPILSREEIHKALASYARELDTRSQQIGEAANHQQPLPWHVTALFSYSQEMLAAEKIWLQSFIQQLEAHDG